VKRVILILMVVSLFLGSCTSNNTEVDSMDSDILINTSFMYWPGVYWIEIANEKGWFKEEGLNVQLSYDANVDFSGSEKAIANGEINTGLMPLFDLMTFRATDKNLVAIILVDISFGADQIVAREGIDFIHELKGKKVGVSKGTFLEFMLEKALEKNGLTTKEITLIDVQAEDISQLENGTVDAMLTWEPFASKLKKNINAKTIFDSSDILGLIPDTIVFDKKFTDENPKEVQTFVNVWHKTSKYIKDNPDQAFTTIARIYNVTLEDVKTFESGVKIQDLRENKIAFSYAAGFESLHGTARQINQFMNEHNITDKKLDSTDFIDARFIRAIEE
jgi:NitT/TauT family transport system substrate-binding protein